MPLKPQSVRRFIDAHRVICFGSQVVEGLRDKVSRSCLALLAAMAFQACSFNHSGISPLWNQWFTAGPNHFLRKLCQTCQCRNHFRSQVPASSRRRIRSAVPWILRRLAKESKWS